MGIVRGIRKLPDDAKLWGTLVGERGRGESQWVETMIEKLQYAECLRCNHIGQSHYSLKHGRYNIIYLSIYLSIYISRALVANVLSHSTILSLSPFPCLYYNICYNMYYSRGKGRERDSMVEWESTFSTSARVTCLSVCVACGGGESAS
jgi:hypothetical protein